ncbi:DUF262 domain-containing protein [Mesorhizobium sp. B2-2-4]|uniref:GmrSD restriction endonuclease domain-containing protein n=1 Tax=unclassified Mesorhizobium TaxID=325217 RepID=UPI001127FCEB|nr:MULTISPECIES: DUF262 domain-containing protein [unclassified Mesorhizobium]TPK01563.1 DUF262 domain-containing protein [Mesorhizobium sp. B2-5-12]TPK26610.1 DUF262 domain-containing protein [Mesorhizobium sp. B2-5-6]TPM64202.1 DUF262 domain-containing protein [Mesorhizobium sp. B2-2-4]TPN62874.1 DUF262 domain-containing protein [Mesorhizobium sp. B1-1-3]
MKAKSETMTVGDLVELHKEQMLKANPEYQRGIVWNSTQKKKLIDSVLRGYPLPRIYLHHVSKSVAGMKSEGLEVIDGQQRINALSEFAQGAFKLFDPIVDAAAAKFPGFIQNQPCDWAHKNFEGLGEELQARFLDASIPVAKIETKDANEVRDLFVRLQGGVPLSAQERRDAFPGNFTDFILQIGGKPELVRYPGHDFFVRSLGMKPGQDRGKTRQLAAQIAVLFFHRRESGADSYCDINAQALDDFYYQNLDFDSASDGAARLVAILDKLAQLLQPGKHGKLRGHDAIHLVLLTDTLWDDYVRSWEGRLPEALDKFLAAVAEGNLTRKASTPSEYWSQYAQWTRVNSDRGDTIAQRHRFYQEKMLGSLQPLQPKDPVRLYGELERSVLFYRQKKQCAVCDVAMNWREVEIHHIEEHGKGGPTSLENGAAVHKKCHPKSATETQALAEKLNGSGRVA